jgi:Domain of Unknown Function (DUF1206)
MTSTQNPVARLAAEHPGVVKFGRIGWLAKGTVYLVAGVLALLVVFRSFGWAESATGEEASPTGAIKEVAHTAGGPLLLVILAIGMFLYVIWRVATAVLPGSTDAESVATRVGYIVSAVIYTTFALTAISLARAPASTADGNQKVRDITERIMEHSLGRWVIGIVGVIAIGAGLYRIMRGFKGDVTDDVDMSGMSSERARWTRRLGNIGEVGRGIAIGIIGFFLLRAAMTFHAEEATGLDGALRRFAENSWGVALVAVVGVGFVAYGVFCAATFTRHRLQAP